MNNTNICHNKLKILFKTYNLKNNTRNTDKLVKSIYNIFKSNDIIHINKNIDTYINLYSICSPPEYKIEISYLLLKHLDYFKFVLKNHNKNSNIRILWSGYEYLCQYIACYLGIKLSQNKLSRAIEQTNYTKLFTECCGYWNEEYDNLFQLLKKYNKNVKETIVHNEVIHIRKKIWDYYSLKFAESDKFKNTIIVLYNNFSKDILEKTLFKIELNNLNSDKLCVLLYKTGYGFIMNPMLSNFKIYKFNKNKNMVFNFISFNKNVMNTIYNFIKLNVNNDLTKKIYYNKFIIIDNKKYDIIKGKRGGKYYIKNNKKIYITQ
jgi:hypothetical protein